ncbi:MAG: AAA family ATPase [Proteobacteria bacterium]|nr:AAA family ATPase [Pseudomonadota bacterium]
MASYLKESLRQALKDVKARDGKKGGAPSAGAPARSTTPKAPATPPKPPVPAVRRTIQPPAPTTQPVDEPPRARGVVRPRGLPLSTESIDDEDTFNSASNAPTARISMSAPAQISAMAEAFDRPVIVAPPPTRFQPLEPKSLEDAGLESLFVEGLVLKYLHGQPGSTGRAIALALALNRRPVGDVLAALKKLKLVEIRSGTATGDFKYALTADGRARVVDLLRHSRYVGPAPVPFEQYLVSVREQSIANEAPKMDDLKRAFQDLLVPERLLQQLGPAMTSGRGLFLFGFPGNGKTSLAERMTRAFGTSVYPPYAILIEGTLIKVFDPMVHEPLETARTTLSSRERTDPRWVKCRRPTVVAGGELTMDSLEIDFDARTGICEAPLQMKANCGTFVVDDFGRQRMDPATLLNRWIVPLEQRIDYLRMPDGRKVQVPFDPLLVFSTNLDPKDLCDEAFLRRIPYKINVDDPNEREFRTLLHIQAELLGFEPDSAAFDYLIERHYKRTERPFRNCHPRDLVLQVKHQCTFREMPLRLSRAGFDEAAHLYFTLL